MSLVQKYQRFIASPTADALAENATINYITTTTTVHEPLPILKHLVAQAKQLEKKSEKVLGTVEGSNALSLDIETTIEFKTGGGAYLPGLDDNFLVDRVVTLPIVHTVHYDANQKITQIRQFWDQASLLKQIEVIGARGKNWPIRNGKDQIRLFAVSSAGAAENASRPATATSNGSNTSRKSSSVSATSDPHASLNLFAPREPIEEEELSTYEHSVAPRVSKKPTTRVLSELIGNEDNATQEKLDLPIKAGVEKKWGANRLFDEDEATPQNSPMKTSIKTDDKKYKHFEFGNGEDTPAAKTKDRKKHDSQWGFDDFYTPQKAPTKIRENDVRHFGWSDDEDRPSPAPRPVVHQPRPSTETHFEFKDDGTPDANRTPAPPKGRLHNSGLGLYKDHILGDDVEDTPSAGHKKLLSDVTTAVNNEKRGKTFDRAWEMQDDSPQTKRNPPPEPQKNIGQDRKKVLKDMEAHWGLYDESPEKKAKENFPKERGINIGGNGMGGKSGYSSAWITGGDDAPPEQPRPKQSAARAKQTNASFDWDF